MKDLKEWLSEQPLPYTMKKEELIKEYRFFGQYPKEEEILSEEEASKQAETEKEEL